MDDKKKIINMKVSKLLDLGKGTGFLTYDEINDAFPYDNFSVEEMSGLLGILYELDIEVFDVDGVDDSL